MIVMTALFYIYSFFSSLSTCMMGFPRSTCCKGICKEKRFKRALPLFPQFWRLCTFNCRKNVNTPRLSVTVCMFLCSSGVLVLRKQRRRLFDETNDFETPLFLSWADYVFSIQLGLEFGDCVRLLSRHNLEDKLLINQEFGNCFLSARAAFSIQGKTSRDKGRARYSSQVNYVENIGSLKTINQKYKPTRATSRTRFNEVGANNELKTVQNSTRTGVAQHNNEPNFCGWQQSTCI